jgi:predicted small secreted protein
MRTVFCAMLLVMMGVSLGCNTIRGVGKDIEAGGEAIADTAESTQEAITKE